MYILEELKKVLRLSNGGWNINSQKSVLTFGGSIKLNQFYVYQIVDTLPILITKARSLLEIDSKIDLYICERESIF
jgi:hypothetical protein